MIHGYVDQTSVEPGSTLTLHVSTDAPRWDVEFFRQGARFERIGDLGLGSTPGKNLPFHTADQDWGVDGVGADGNALPAWPGFDVTIPSTWASGVYVAVFTEEDDARQSISNPDISTADARDSKAMFVVKSAHPGASATILYKVNLFTFQAYNLTATPLQSLYVPNEGGPGEAAVKADKVNLRRPGGGTGGTPHDTLSFPDEYDLSSPRESVAHWDSHLISWLEGNGYHIDYCTDLDIHTDDGSFLRKYRLMLSNGHDEYWSQKMYDNVFTFIGGGGNAAFFTANTCWFRTIVSDDNTTIAREAEFFNLDMPENRVIGVSYRNGGGQWQGRRPTDAGYTVVRPDHWVFEGTGLTGGEVFGNHYGGNPADPAALVGYEADGVAFDRSQLGSGQPITPSFDDSTPDTFEILAVCDLTGWQDPHDNTCATMGVYDRGGTVFNAATCDWSRVLGSGKEPSVDRITRNVLNRLSAARP